MPSDLGRKLTLQQQLASEGFVDANLSTLTKDSNMEKSIARFLVLVMFFAASGKCIYATTAPGTEERSAASSVVAPAVAAVTSPSSGPWTAANSNPVEAESADTAEGQATPTSGQASPRHHSHHVRNILIGVAAILALAVIFAVAAK
jgi:hypothetical protein